MTPISLVLTLETEIRTVLGKEGGRSIIETGAKERAGHDEPATESKLRSTRLCTLGPRAFVRLRPLYME